MQKIRKDPARIFLRIRKKNGQTGVVIVELLVAAIIFALVFAAVAFYFVFHVGTMNAGRAQLKLQRVGSLLVEEMSQAIRGGRRTDLDEGISGNALLITYPDSTTRYFAFDAVNKDIRGGADYNNNSPLESLDDSQTVGGQTRSHRIFCDGLSFARHGDTVTIRFTLRHDLDDGDGGDDLVISFGSTVKMRG